MILPVTAPAHEIVIDRLVLDVPGFTPSDVPALGAALAERLAGAGRASDAGRAGDYARIDIALSAAPATNAALAEQIAAALMQRFA